MGDSDFRPPAAPKPEPIELKFGMIDHVQHGTPHAKTDTRRLRGIWWGRGEIATSRTKHSP